MKVSVFKNFLNGERITTCAIGELAETIRRGIHDDAISDYRCASPQMLAVNRYGNTQQSAVRTADNRIPRLCFASEFRRKNGVRHIVNRNPLVLLEIDDLTDYSTAISVRNSAARQPYTLLAFIGANGRSVEIVCRVSTTGDNIPADEDAFRLMMAEGYRRLHYVYSAQLGVNIRMQTPADDTMCLMGTDRNVYYSPGAAVFMVDVDRPSAVYHSVSLHDDGDESPLPGKTRDEAYRYIFYACWDKVLDSGLDHSSPYFVERAVGMLARFCRRSGLPQQLCIDRASLIDAINSDRDLITMLFKQAYGGNIVNTSHTACVSASALMAMQADNFFHKHFRLRRNALNGIVQYKRLGTYDTDYRPVTQEVINTMAIMAQREGIRIWARDMKERVNSTLVETYDPIANYLSSLPRWDGHDRLTAFSARVPTDNPRWTEFFTVWMRSMVAQWMGTDRDHGNSLVPLLVGAQGCGKTSFTKIILPGPLREYYNDRIDFKNDNAMMQSLSSFALINIDEFDSYSIRRQPLIKYLISKSEVTSIKAYRSTFSTSRRTASFIATTNNPRPLTDATGSRRFICATVTGDIDFSSPADYGQLYAQLVYEVRHGLPYYLDSEATTRLTTFNHRYLRHADLNGILLSMFRQPAEGEKGQELTATEIAETVRKENPGIPPSRLSITEVGKRLKAYGFPNRHTRKGTLYTVELNTDK